ncbi:MAG: calcium/sodium antiporter [Salinibacter sp.]|uniref:calcium/sodium antiporter n=1 Tax=Salinibacter sp. TaxID=2065818 RepID=UPI0035D4FB8A
MVLHVLLFFVGLLVLYLGAEGLVQGASSIALQYGIRPVVVGLTVVALGTSMPEFLVNFFALFEEASSLAIGNIIGSNISNVALILGTSALALPMVVTPAILRREYPAMLGTMALFYIVALDGIVSSGDGVLMVLVLAGLAAYVFYDARRTTQSAILEDVEEDLQTADPTMSGMMKGVYLIGGIAGLALGARLMVVNAVSIAKIMGVERVVIGLTIVAVGTSLPELAASMVGALRNESDLSVGNVMGSNILNVLFVVGTLSIADPIPVAPNTLAIHFPVMLGFCVLLLPLTWTTYRISRWKGGLMLTAFIGYMTYLVLPHV